MLDLKHNLLSSLFRPTSARQQDDRTRTSDGDLLKERYILKIVDALDEILTQLPISADMIGRILASPCIILLPASLNTGLNYETVLEFEYSQSKMSSSNVTFTLSRRCSSSLKLSTFLLMMTAELPAGISTGTVVFLGGCLLVGFNMDYETPGTVAADSQ